MMPCSAPFQQSQLFADALTLARREVLRLDLPDATALALRRRPFPALVSRGPVWHGAPDDTAKAASFRAAARHGVWLINAEHPEDAPALKRAGFRQIMTATTIAETDLTRPEAELRAGLHGKWRNRLVAAQAGLPATHKVSLRSFDPARDGWLLAQETAQQKQQKYRALPPALVLALSQAAPRALRMATLTNNGAPLAAMLFVIHETRALYHIGWSGAEGRRLGAHNLLLWHAMTKLKSSGVTCLELGTVDTDTTPSLARFKLGSGARARALGGTWLRLWP